MPYKTGTSQDGYCCLRLTETIPARLAGISFFMKGAIPLHCQMRNAPVVQRIGLWSTKPGIEVRILSGAQMEFWQTRCMRRTENPENVVRFHETPLHGGNSSAGQNAGLWIRRSRVRIFPFPHHARMVKWLTRRSAKPLLAGSSPEFPTDQEFCISLNPQN